MQHTSIVHRLPIIIIFLLSTFLHLHGLADDSLWGDEIFTAIFASKSPLETIEFTASDIHPPFYYLLVGGLIKELPSKKTGSNCLSFDSNFAKQTYWLNCWGIVIGCSHHD
ncbi:MAG: hypothetical protein B6242_11360 [Anaerolineaceae bacterium 4572_78]|nr:MAG: hypothetical protein B6242_11360 [Anaerolineaceae bacterium 4572_78]